MRTGKYKFMATAVASGILLLGIASQGPTWAGSIFTGQSPPRATNCPFIPSDQPMPPQPHFYPASYIGRTGVPKVSASDKQVLKKIIAGLPASKRKLVRFVFARDTPSNDRVFTVFLLDECGGQAYPVLNPGMKNTGYDMDYGTLVPFPPH